MKLPESTKFKAYIWLTTQTTPGFNVCVTSIDGMESQGWTLLAVKEIEINLTDLNIDIKKVKCDAIEAKRQKLTDQYEQSMLQIEDELRLTKELEQ